MYMYKAYSLDMLYVASSSCHLQSLFKFCFLGQQQNKK